jgi:hypothetical protein
MPNRVIKSNCPFVAIAQKSFARTAHGNAPSALELCANLIIERITLSAITTAREPYHFLGLFNIEHGNFTTGDTTH